MNTLIYSDYGGGVYIYTLRLVQALSRLGCRIDLLAPEPTTAAAEERRSQLEAAGVASTTIVKRDASQAALSRQVTKHVTETSPQIAIPNYRRHVYGAFLQATLRTDTRLIGVCHNHHSSYYSLLGRFARGLDGLICPSRHTYATAVQRWGGRIQCAYIPHAIPLPSRVARYEGGCLHLVYHGRLAEEQKRVGRLIEIADQLRKLNVDFHLWLIGDGPDRDLYRRAIAQQDLSRFVSFRPQIGWSRLTSKLTRCHIAVLTSEYEGFCMSLAEAMGAGLPAVAFNTDGVIEEYAIENENAFIVEQDNAIAFATRVAQFHDNMPLWRDMSRAAHETISEQYSCELFASRTYAYFKELLNRKKCSSWPRLRPYHVDDRQWSMPAVIEKLGLKLGVWSSQ